MWSTWQSLWTLDYQVITQSIYLQYFYHLVESSFEMNEKVRIIFFCSWQSELVFLLFSGWSLILKWMKRWECKVIIFFCSWQREFGIQLNFSSRMGGSFPLLTKRRKKNMKWPSFNSKHFSNGGKELLSS